MFVTLKGKNLAVIAGALITAAIIMLVAMQPSNRPQAASRFLSKCGYVVEKAPVEICDVLVPEELDNVFNMYNELQKKAGFDLYRYRGKTLQKYSFRVLNMGNGFWTANVLFYDKKIVGGDVMSTALDGFMLPLRYKNY